VTGEATRVYTFDADDPGVGQVLIHSLGRAMVRVATDRLPDDETCDTDAAGLGVLVVHPVVADMRIGHRNDLRVIARIGKDLLVAAQSGVEDGLSGRLPFGAERGSVEGRAVL
jgi:hypothetical protein